MRVTREPPASPGVPSRCFPAARAARAPSLPSGPVGGEAGGGGGVGGGPPLGTPGPLPFSRGCAPAPPARPFLGHPRCRRPRSPPSCPPGPGAFGSLPVLAAAPPPSRCLPRSPPVSLCCACSLPRAGLALCAGPDRTELSVFDHLDCRNGSFVSFDRKKCLLSISLSFHWNFSRCGLSPPTLLRLHAPSRRSGRAAASSQAARFTAGPRPAPGCRRTETRRVGFCARAPL